MQGSDIGRDKLIEWIVGAVTDFRLTMTDDTEAHVEETTTLFGDEGILDSLGLVTVVLELEERVNATLTIPISIADERAISQRNSPFRTVGTLADYTWTLVNGAAGDG
jgi:D-alanine--poly(phosphoribitol) ligase subunit 2